MGSVIDTLVKYLASAANFSSADSGYGITGKANWNLGNLGPFFENLGKAIGAVGKIIKGVQ